MTDRNFNPSRRKATGWNLLFDYGALTLTMVRNLALVPLYLQHIDRELYGFWLATGAALATMFVSDFGLLGVVVQRTGSAYGARDFPRLERLIGTGLLIVTCVVATLAIMSAALAPVITSLLDLDPAGVVLIRNCFLIVVFANAMSLFGTASEAILRSLQEPFVPGLFKLLSEILSILATVWLILQGWGLYALATGIMVRGAVLATGNFSTCMLRCRWRFAMRLRWSRETLRSMLRDSFYQFFTSIGMRLQTYSNPFIVGVILGGDAAAIYGFTVQAFVTIRLFLGRLSAAISPSLAHLHGTGNMERFRDIFNRMVQSFALVGLVGMSGLFVFNRHFVFLWLGSENYGGDLVTILLVVFGLATVLASAPYEALVSTGQFRTISQVTWLALLVQIPLAFAVVRLGIWGVVAASLLGMMLTGALLTKAVWPRLGLMAADFRVMASGLIRIMGPGIVVAVAAFLLLPQIRSWLGFLWQSGAFAILILATTALANRQLFRQFVQEFRDTVAADSRSGRPAL